MQGACGAERSVDRTVGSATADHEGAAAHELRHEPGRRPVVEIVGRGPLLDPPLAHHADLVGDGEGLLLVMRDEQCGGAVAFQDLAQLCAQLPAQLGVEARQRFIQQQQLRSGCQRARQRDTLLLAAREFVRPPRGEPSEAHRIDQLQCACAALRGRLVVQAEGDIGEHIEVREQRMVLEHHADTPFVRWQLHAGCREHASVGEHATGVGRFEARDDAQQRRLTAAAGAEQAADRARRERERDVPQHRSAAERSSYRVDLQLHRLIPGP